MNRELTADAYKHAAWMLACDIPAIRAVADTESGKLGGFNDDDSPVILYEPHEFHRHTGGKFDARYPDLSYPKWRPGQYGKNSDQHPKLARAIELDRDAALKSCSWGTFQIMGGNHRAAGYLTVQRMVNAAHNSADDHLRMFVNYIISRNGLIDALRGHDWKTFAMIYNGPRYAENNYDTRMREAYEKFAKEKSNETK